MSGEVRRYAHTKQNYRMTPAEDGPYVLWDDYAALLARVEAAERDAARWLWFARHCVRTPSLDMGGNYRYSVTGAFARVRGPSLDAAIDQAMGERGDSHA